MSKTAKRPKINSSAATAPEDNRRWPWLLTAACLLVAGGTWATLEFVVWNVMPSALVGKWEVTSGPQEGATFDFYRNGRLLGHVNNQGNLEILDARVRVEGDKIYSTTTRPSTGEQSTFVQTIRTLTDTDLTIEDAQGRRMFMRRVQ